MRAYVHVCGNGEVGGGGGGLVGCFWLKEEVMIYVGWGSGRLGPLFR